MLVTEFDFYLPEELIAQQPLCDRAAARMLHLRRETNGFRDTHFGQFPDLLRPDDLVVFNNTRVLPARLYGRRAGIHSQPLSPQNPAMKEFLHGRMEVLLTKQLSSDPQTWEALVRPGRKIGIGEQLYFGEGERGELQAEVVARGEFGERTVRFQSVADFFGTLERLGHVPLPPYIHRADRPEDREQYQTIFARERGSVAAPTAGLHFTPEILERLRQRGIETAEVTLHVGLGTFQPVRSEVVEQHRIHRERYSISPEASEKINRARSSGRRIVAVGTTSVRTLEFAAQQSAAKAGDTSAAQQSASQAGDSFQAISAQSGEADIFIYPGFQFRVVGAMLTNFHLPQSTLLMLVSAFAGRERVLAAYEHAVRERYRFFSYGDCMLIE
ncbi:MAG TPA: tRNA preQ1(34) S-adenosylmethionine ribosyltransferase-isomerase QueA [Clostridia bacterium]|nr:tRNA preQ1(34) S-adenosylmethionine ribosyltransferase-isomerase QueA [Clostridia bacterium]